MYMHIVAQYHLSAGFVLIYGYPVANKAMPPRPEGRMKDDCPR
jgi:hypothetical protein